MKARLLDLVVGGVAGLAVAAAFPPWNMWLLAVAGLAGLAWSLRGGAWFAALVGLVHGLVFFGIHLTWAQFSVGLIPWVALAASQSLFIAVAMGIWSWLKKTTFCRNALVQAATFALVWTAAEEARSRVPFGGFPWGRVAFSQTDGPLVRLAWLGGAPLVSLAVALAAGLVWVAFTRLRFAGAMLPLLAAFALIAAPWALPIGGGTQAQRFTVGAVQGNVPNKGLDAFAQAREVLDNHLAGTAALASHAGTLDLVVWPENGADVNPQHDGPAGAAVDAAAASVRAPILLGTLEYPASGGRYNRALVWQAGTGVIDTYDKQRPAAFAEYIPLRSLARKFSAAVDRVTTDMLPGTGVATVDVPSPRLGRPVVVSTIICFEVAYDALVRTSIAAGGEFIVVQTNNASFGYTPESLQQLAISRLRAVEFGRYTIQISTVGVSGTIAPNGALTHTTEHFAPAQFVSTVDLESHLTPAVRTGPVLAWAILGAAAALVALGWMTRPRQRRPVQRRPKGT